MGVDTKRLDQMAIEASIVRSPFNPHEKLRVGNERVMYALLFKDGYRAAKKETSAEIDRLRGVLEKIAETGGWPGGSHDDAVDLANAALADGEGAGK